jgi:hypothetical protein
VSDGRLLVAGVLGALVVGRAACGSRGVVRRTRDLLPDRCKFCGATEDVGCSTVCRSGTRARLQGRLEDVLVPPVRLTGVLAGHPLVKQNLGGGGRDRPDRLRVDLILESDEHGNLVVENVMTNGKMLFHPEDPHRSPRKDDRVAVTAWKCNFGLKDRKQAWCAYEQEVETLERAGSRGVVRTGRRGPAGFSEDEDDARCDEPEACTACDSEHSMTYERVSVNGDDDRFGWLCMDCGHAHLCVKA